MTRPGLADYRDGGKTTDRESGTEGIMDQVTESARDAGSRAAGIAEELALTVKERPYTTLAIAAGLAFAVGAAWKLGYWQRQSRIERLLAQLPDLPDRNTLAHWWRQVR
jgi:hypothetical protein